jgi:hypothetical protein
MTSCGCVNERLDALTREIKALREMFQITYQVDAAHWKEAMQDYRLRLPSLDEDSSDESDDSAEYTSDPEVEVDLDDTDEPEEGIVPKPKTDYEKEDPLVY